MKRTGFIRILTLLGVLPMVSGYKTMVEVRAPETDEALIYGGFVMGLAFYNYRLAHDSLSKGSGLDLVREPDNAYDKYAIEVWFGDLKLGYLPRRENKTLAHLLDQKHKLRCEIRHVDQTWKNTWDGLYVKVFGSIG